MKRVLILALLAAFIVPATGCGTIYKAARDQRSLEVQASDKSIEAAIIKRLADDDTVKVLSVSTFCFTGHVYLVGEYETTAQRDAAKRIAAGVEGVRSVTTYMLKQKEDPECGTKENVSLGLSVRKDLIADGDMNSTNVEVKSVQCGIVLLGIVETSADASRAVSIARAVEGVRYVKSYLRIAK